MKKVILSQNTKIAVFYDTLDNPEIENGTPVIKIDLDKKKNKKA